MMSETATKTQRRSKRRKGERAASDPPSLETVRPDVTGWQPALSRKGGHRIKVQLTADARRQLREVQARGEVPKVQQWACDARSRDRLDPITIKSVVGVAPKKKRAARSTPPRTMSASARQRKLKMMQMGLA